MRMMRFFDSVWFAESVFSGTISPKPIVLNECGCKCEKWTGKRGRKKKEETSVGLSYYSWA